MITLNPGDINQVNKRGLKDTLEYKSNKLYIKPTQIEDV